MLISKHHQNIAYLALSLYCYSHLLVFFVQFVYNLMVVSKAHNNKPIEDFILVSPAPVDTAAKLSNIYVALSAKVS
jgi:hypothetical protein